MENKNVQKQDVIPVKKFSITLVVAMIAFLLFGALTVYYYSQKRGLENQITEIETSIADFSTKIDQLKEQEVEKALLAKKSLEELKKSKILWSDVVTKLLDNTPKASSKANAKSRVDYSSYSGNQDAKITVSGTTKDYEYISDLIDILNKSKIFGEVLIPSISKGVDEKGDNIYVFSLNMDYLEEAEDVVKENGASEEVEGIPRT